MTIIYSILRVINTGNAKGMRIVILMMAVQKVLTLPGCFTSIKNKN